MDWKTVGQAARQGVMDQVFWYWIPVVFFAGAMFFLSAQSRPQDILPSFVFRDVSNKVLHAVGYGILFLLCYRGFRWTAGQAVARHAVVLAIIMTALFGLTDETHQLFVPLRESSWQDWSADIIGAAIGTLSWWSMRSE